MSAFLNIGSLALGLLSWLIPVLSLKRKPGRISVPGASFLCCALALLLQLAEVMHRVTIGDLTAVMDTISAVVLAGAVMLGVCGLANLLIFLRDRK